MLIYENTLQRLLIHSLCLSWIQAGGAVLENARNENGGGEKEPGKPV